MNELRKKTIYDKILSLPCKTFNSITNLKEYVEDFSYNITFSKSPFEFEVNTVKNNEPFKINLININNEIKEVSNSSKVLIQFKKLIWNTTKVGIKYSDHPKYLFIGNCTIVKKELERIIRIYNVNHLFESTDCFLEAKYKHNSNLSNGLIYDYIFIDIDHNENYLELLKSFRVLESKYMTHTKIAILFNNYKEEYKLISDRLCK